MAEPVLSFFAEHVGTDTTAHTPEFVVYLIAFGRGDPQAGGHEWNFSRCFEEDWGVCTVREIQEAVVYGGIERFRLQRFGVECDFDPKAAKELGFFGLRIAFEVDDTAWHELLATAKIVFRDCAFFSAEA
jgi:hypothetical protein